MPQTPQPTAKSQNACRRRNTGTSAVLQEVERHKPAGKDKRIRAAEEKKT